MGQRHGIILPPGAVRIEYVENSNNARLDTGYTPTSDTVMQIKYMPLALTGNVVLGYYVSDSNDFRFFNSDGRVFFDSFGNTRIYSAKNVQVINNVYELEFGNFYVKNLSTGTVIVSKSTPYTGTGNGTIYLNSPNINWVAVKNRWYYLKFYEGNTLKMYLIPIRIGTVGYLYDVVSQQTISTWTGSWDLGPDL